MATIDQYKIQIDVAGAEKVKNLESSLDSLGSKIAAIGFGAFIANAFRMADAMTDLSDATGIALENVIAFGNAMSAAGGDANNADKALITFYKNLEEMAAGSDQAEEKLAKVGITMQDLRTLSEEQILQKAIDNLAAMDEGAKRTAAGVDNFSKVFNTIDPKKFKETFDPGKTKEYAANMRLAGDAVENLAKNFKLLQQAAVDVFGPLLNGLSQFKLDIGSAQKIIIALSALMAAAFGAKVAGYIYNVVKAIQALNAATKTQTVLQIAALAAGGPRGWAMLAGGAAAATGAVIGLNKLLDENAKKQQTALAAAGGDMGAGGGAFAPDASEFTKKEKEQRELAAQAAARTTEQMRKQFEIANGFRRLQIDLIGLQNDYSEGIKQDAAIVEQLQNDVIEYTGKIAEEQAKGKDANQELINQYTEQLKIKQEQAAATIITNNLERDRIKILNDQIQAIQNGFAYYENVEQIKKNSFDLDIANQLALGKLTKEQAEFKKRIFDLELQKTAKAIALTKEIQIAAKKGDMERVQALQDELNRTKQLYDAKIAGAEQEQQINQAIQESSIAGAIDALSQIKKALSPFQLAQDAILMTWGKIGNAIDTFVETGKFKFSDFARSIIADLAKMIAKAMIFKAISAALGAFGLKIPGMAEGGPVQSGQPYLVGEKGPELFVPPGAGTIIPNKKLGQGQSMASGAVSAPITNNYNTYNINALDAKSVAQVFAENRKAIFGANKLAEREMSYAGAR